MDAVWLEFTLNQHQLKEQGIRFVHILENHDVLFMHGATVYF